MVWYDDAPIQVAERAKYKKCDKMGIDILNNVTLCPYQAVIYVTINVLCFGRGDKNAEAQSIR